MCVYNAIGHCSCYLVHFTLWRLLLCITYLDADDAKAGSVDLQTWPLKQMLNDACPVQAQVTGLCASIAVCLRMEM